jgi:hypothetical protein
MIKRLLKYVKIIDLSGINIINHKFFNTNIIFDDLLFTYPDFDYLKLSTDKKIILSVTGFGNQEDALNMLKGLSTLGNGSFIHIRNERESVNALLEEIKGRSKR